MAIRKIIQIDQSRCNGCGKCARACHEGAIAIRNGVATLIKDDYCDGLGDCLPACPMDAISFVEREAADYDEAAVKEHLANREQEEQEGRNRAFDRMFGHGGHGHGGHGHGGHGHGHGGGCPGSRAHAFERQEAAADVATGLTSASVPNEISTWPIQIKLVNPDAYYFEGCDLLIAADCTAFAYGNFHHDFMKGKVTIIGCPKLDMVDYTDKLAQIIANNDIRSVQMCRMVVPCCGGLEMAVRNAVAMSGKDIPLDVVTFELNGDLMA